MANGERTYREMILRIKNNKMAIENMNEYSKLGLKMRTCSGAGERLMVVRGMVNRSRSSWRKLSIDWLIVSMVVVVDI